MLEAVPASVTRLLWDVDPAAVDLDRDRALVFARIMTRGSWEAMQWLRRYYPREVLADFVMTEGRVGYRPGMSPTGRSYSAFQRGDRRGRAPALGREMTSGITDTQRIALAELASGVDEGTYLAGGVAVAVALHHRESIDLDLFVPHDFDPERLVERLRNAAPSLRVVGRARGTLHAEVAGVPVSVLSYRYPLLAPTRLAEGLALPLASLEDLACMKVSAIAGRGAAKDFWDLAELLAANTCGGELESVLVEYTRKFPIEDVSHAIKSLSYFGEADAAPLPRGLSGARWTAIKSDFEKRVVRLSTAAFERAT